MSQSRYLSIILYLDFLSLFKHFIYIPFVMDYFLNVGKKSCIKNKNIFDTKGADRDCLLTVTADIDPRQIATMYREWKAALLTCFNIAVFGRESKFKLLEKFGRRCHLIANVKIIRLHGFDPVSLEKFNYSLLGKKSIEDYAASIEEEHHFFIMHNFELLYKNCQVVCDQILKLSLLKPTHIHMVVSFGHLHANKIYDSIKLSHNFISYQYCHGDSYHHERQSVIGELDHVQTGIFDRQLDLQSLRDIYQALQANAKRIMKYILENHVKLSESGSNEALVEHPLGGAMIPAKKRAAREAVVDHLKFDVLMSYCEREFIARRFNMLRNHLGELEDHRIIELDSTKTKIHCLISVASCKEFLQQLEVNGTS